MTDRDALLAAILANPSDDVPRLVFADWLDEHGEHDRAEFIRVQCELARMEDDDRGHLEPYRYVGWNSNRPAFVGPPPAEWRARDPDAFERATLTQRSSELYRRLAAVLGRESPHQLAPNDYDARCYRRGFLDAWDERTATDFLRTAPRAFRQAPLTDMAIQYIRTPAAAARVASSGRLDRIRVLRLSRTGPAVELLDRLAETPASSTITELALTGNVDDDERGDDEFDPSLLLKAVTRFPNLQRLALDYGPPLPDDDLGRLLASPVGRGLRHLDLSHAGYGQGAVRVLATAGGPNLRSLVLNGCEVGSEARALGRERFPELRVLHLSHCLVGPEPALDLLAPNFGRLECLNLRGNPIAELGAGPPRVAGPASTLRTLNLTGSWVQGGLWEMAPQDVAGLVVMSALGNLRKLALDRHPLWDEGAVHLAAGASFGNLCTLVLSGCRIGPAGVEALAGSRFLAGLAQLDLTDNEIGRAGAEALARSPHLTGLAALLVDESTPGIELLRDRFGDALHAVDDSIPF